MNWKEMVPKCFGMVDKVYAGHEIEKQHARKMISAAKKAGATKDEVADALCDYLEQVSKDDMHIEAQIRTFRKNTAKQSW
ncbi:hypothetical protein [Halodesulfovibrio sp.]|jgi:hypothetical protein|uniref:hypothetical protein n=1 Tax=Halodesulfovibrio sp. TaxID=1912772 RepID=UPI0025D15A7A|nr:hypothetical protein [Halodesulfovibrio sp.]MCT4626453.1 hypothetical protein [Halodesulfovibrio sp.]